MITTQATRVLSTVFGGTFVYDALTILTLAEEDGELKVFHSKDFADPEKRLAVFTGAVNAAAEKTAT